MNRLKQINAGFITCFFLLTLAFPLFTTTEQAEPTAPSPLGSAFTSSHAKEKPNWNKNGYNWEQLDNGSGVNVIIAMDQKQCSSLDKTTQKALLDNQTGTFKLAFSGISANLDARTLNRILKQNPDIEIQPDFEMRAFVAVNQTGADAMWNRSDVLGYPIKGTGVVVAIIDTGIDYNHPDLGAGFGPSYRVIDGWDFYNNDANPMDDEGHGTHCAGIVGANGTIRGMAPECSFLAYKVLGSGGSGPTSVVIAGIERATDPNDDGDTSDHADVLSMSLGAIGQEDDAACLAVNAAVDAGAVVCVATGNDGPMMTVSSPALAEKCIGVGAVYSSGTVTTFSSRGPTESLNVKPEVGAPGYAIYSTYKGGGYATMSGTSMATPHVAGAAALVIQSHPDWTAAQVKSALVTGAHQTTDSIWLIGSGQLWVPGADDTDVFLSKPIISSGMGGTIAEFNVTNLGATATFTANSSDWRSMTYSYAKVTVAYDNLSSLDDTEFEIATENSLTINLTVPTPASDEEQGYYDGDIHIVNGIRDVHIRFGYLVLCLLMVHVYDLVGQEVTDHSGTVSAYSIPDVNVSVSDEAAPPANFLIPTGNYSVHAVGHYELCFDDDTFILSTTIELAEPGMTHAYLQMASAHRMLLNLQTDEGCPIYVDHFWIYMRYVGDKNVSFHMFSIDDWITGTDYFWLPKYRWIYVSDTDVTVGIAIAGYAYSQPMYDFMYRNNAHWYETIGSTSTDFRIEASADQEYLLSWEFDGIDSSTSNLLGLQPGDYSVYESKLDIPGAVDLNANFGDHLSMGTSSNQYLRRDTGTSIPPIFSGMTKNITVQGVFEEYYTPGKLTDTAFDQQFFVPDYNVLVNYSYDTNLVYVPDRNNLTSGAPTTGSYRVGQGPYWPCVYTNNTNDSMYLFLPILRDQGGAKVVGRGVGEPDVSLYKGASLLGTYHLSEFQRTLDAIRVVGLSGAGTYIANISYSPYSQICVQTYTILGFVVPSLDRDPPRIRDFNMSQRFVPGDVVPITLNVSDNIAVSSVTIDWRNASTESWRSLVVTDMGGGWFNSSVPTGSGNTSISLKVNATDSMGNWLEYQVRNASLNETPISFSISLNDTEFEFTNQATNVLITGYLLNGSNPLSSVDAIPVELRIENGTKVGMILDEYITTGAHTHNGSIRFEWTFNPIYLFDSISQTLNLTAVIDLGIYQVASQAIEITSVTGSDFLPTVMLNGPANNSYLTNGTPIYFSIKDESLVGTNYSWDNATPTDFSLPYTLDTYALTEGYHWVRVNVTDSAAQTTTHSYRFYVDVTEPSLSITWPTNGSSIGMGAIITISASDPSTLYVYWEADLGTREPDASPYGYSVAGMALGEHNLTCIAYDQFGHSAYAWANFNITSIAPTITNSPLTDGVAGTTYEYNSTCTAADSGLNTWNLKTNATFLNLNYSDQTNGYINGTTIVSGVYWVNLSVSDADSGSYTNYSLTILESDPPPTITSSPLLGVWEDHLYSYDAESDQGGLTWTLDTNASWLSMVPATGMISGTPNNSFSELGFYANVSCTNVNGTAYQNYSIHVFNLAPAFTPDIGIPPVTGVVGLEVSYDANHSDEGVGTPPGDFDGLTTNFTGAYTFDTTNGYLNFTPTYAGELWWNITGNDQRGVDNSTNYQNWTMDISEKAPYITSSPVASTTVWVSFYFNCSATLPDSGITTWNQTTNATWLSFIWGNQTRYNVSGTPIALGSYWLNFSVNDSDSSHYLNFTVSVVAGATPVFTSSPPLIAYEDNLYFYQAVCDDHIDTWSLLFNNATWATWNPLNGSFMGTPDNTQSRMYFSMYISATNMNGTEWQNWWMAVYNRAPVFSTSPIIGVVNSTAYSYNSTTDDEGLNATYTVNSNATFAYNIHVLSGEVTFTPDIVGYIWVNITCNDGSMFANATWYQNYTVTISEYTPIIINGPTLIWIVWVFYYFNASSTLPDMGVNVWGFTTNATWLIEGNFGQTYKNISGYPDTIGYFWFNMTVTDGDSSFYLNATLTIIAGPAPTITSTPGLFVTEDSLYFYLPTADQTVTWTLLWLDGTWLTFDPLNGSYTGIPDNSESEFGFNTWLQAGNMNGTDIMMWGVFVYNNPPIFTTAPADLNGTIGVAFTYDPTTTDESIGATAYTVTTNTTDWYTIDATTGQLIFDPTIGGSWWFDIQFDDFSAVANATAHQNFTITVLAIPHTPPGTPGTTPSTPSPISVSFKYVIDGATVHFSDNSYGNASYYIWNFGDGRGSTQKNPDHTYDRPGIYNVTLTVIGKDNRSYTLTTRIAIEQNPVISGHDGGWNIVLTDTLMLRISAVGSLVLGAIMFASAVYMPSSSFIMTNKGRKVIGVLMVVCGISYYIFIDNSWWG